MSEDNNSLGYASAPASVGNRGPSRSGSALTVADVLSLAADLLEPDGAWTRGRYAVEGPNGPCYCVVGALVVVSRDADDDHLSFTAQRVLRESLGVPGVIGWNDAPFRTQAEVVAALREAAARATRDASQVAVTESLQARSRDSDGANQ